MRRTIGLCGALALTALATTPAGAADYPYTGLYTTSDPATDADAALRNCAYNFFSQEKDGSYISDHLDLQHYVAEKTIRYVEYSRGHCAIEDGGLFKRGSVETCTSTFDTDPAEQGKSYIDVYREDGPGGIARVESGDFDLEARLQGLDTADAWAKAGLIARKRKSTVSVAATRTVSRSANPSIMLSNNNR